MKLNACGVIVREAWLRTPSVRSSVMLDAFVIMPNHFHAILWLTEERDRPASAEARFGSSVAGSLAVIVGQFKGIVTRRVNQLRGTPGAAVWQRNYFERIIRTEDELNQTRHYIEENPSDWLQDPYGTPPRAQDHRTSGLT